MKKININFEKNNGLVPAIIQDNKTGVVLMLGYMNLDAWELTFKTGFVYFWSRSRQKLWLKGESSGNKLQVKSISLDCDQDTLLIKVDLIGKAVCHTGSYSCFINQIYEGKTL